MSFSSQLAHIPPAAWPLGLGLLINSGLTWGNIGLTLLGPLPIILGKLGPSDLTVKNKVRIWSLFFKGAATYVVSGLTISTASHFAAYGLVSNSVASTAALVSAISVASALPYTLTVLAPTNTRLVALDKKDTLSAAEEKDALRLIAKWDFGHRFRQAIFAVSWTSGLVALNYRLLVQSSGEFQLYGWCQYQTSRDRSSQWTQIHCTPPSARSSYPTHSKPVPSLRPLRTSLSVGAAVMSTHISLTSYTAVEWKDLRIVSITPEWVGIVGHKRTQDPLRLVLPLPLHTTSLHPSSLKTIFDVLATLSFASLPSVIPPLTDDLASSPSMTARFPSSDEIDRDLLYFAISTTDSTVVYYKLSKGIKKPADIPDE
ncbi:hypothetical protein P7C73_g256, partial [Tremellales sp. Uapishka_1]